MRKKKEPTYVQLSGAEIDRLLDITQSLIVRLENSIYEATSVAHALELLRDEVTDE